MSEKLVIRFIPRNIQVSEFDWADIELNGERAGKIRCLKHGSVLIIHSINVYQQWRGQGLGHKVMTLFKQDFNRIIADKVRYEARRFWKDVGMVPDTQNPGNYVWDKNRATPTKN